MLILFIIVLIFGTSRIPQVLEAMGAGDDPLLVAFRRGLAIFGFGLLTAALFGLGFLTGEEVAVAGWLRISESLAVFGVVSLACLAVPVVPVLKSQVPASARIAPLLFLLVGLVTGIVATKTFGANPQMIGLR